MLNGTFIDAFSNERTRSFIATLGAPHIFGDTRSGLLFVIAVCFAVMWWSSKLVSQPGGMRVVGAPDWSTVNH